VNTLHQRYHTQIQRHGNLYVPITITQLSMISNKISMSHSLVRYHSSLPKNEGGAEKKVEHSTSQNSVDSSSSTSTTPEPEQRVSEPTEPQVPNVILTLPNALTLVRMLSAPVICYYITSSQLEAAIGLLVFAGMLDVLDGYIARRFNMMSLLGSFLDPVADKVLISFVTIALWQLSVLPTYILVLIVGRDLALILGSFMYRFFTMKAGERFFSLEQAKFSINPSNLSKMNTFFQISLLVLALTHLMVQVPSLEQLDLMSMGVGALTLVSWVGYAFRSGIVRKR
jgi:cardiolipin synthase (CMP-forming)